MSNPNSDRDERVSTMGQLEQQGGICRECQIVRGYRPILDYVKLCPRHALMDDAATRMRDRCVVHLRATADALDVRQEIECPSGTAFNSEAALRRRIANELESLTLDQGEQEK